MNEVYNNILKEVCQYFMVRRYDVLMSKSTTRDVHNMARVVAVYLIREFTNDKFFSIGHFFGTTASNAGTQYGRVRGRIESPELKYSYYKRQIQDLKNIVSRKINLDISYTRSTLAT